MLAFLWLSSRKDKWKWSSTRCEQGTQEYGLCFFLLSNFDDESMDYLSLTCLIDTNSSVMGGL